MLDGELIRFSGGAAGLIGLGLAMGFSPTLIAVTLRALTGTPRAERAIGWMLVGLVLGSSALLLLLQVADPRSFEHLLQRDAERILVGRGVDLTAGALFVAAAVWLGIRARRPRRPRRPRGAPKGRPWEMTLIGASNAVIGVSGIATMYMTARLVRGISEDDLVRVIAYAIFVAALISPYIALALAWRRFPAAAARITSTLARFAKADLRPWEAGVTLLAGLVFLGLGIWGWRGL